jgi:hypothetical protein
LHVSSLVRLDFVLCYGHVAKLGQLASLISRKVVEQRPELGCKH